jgi:hypothetical protein
VIDDLRFVYRNSDRSLWTPIVAATGYRIAPRTFFTSRPKSGFGRGPSTPPAARRKRGR